MRRTPRYGAHLGHARSRRVQRGLHDGRTHGEACRLDARDLRCLSGADALATLAGHRPGSVSDAIVPSFIGMFGRTAVAVEDQIRVVIKRTPTRGDMEVTVFASVAPVLPTSDFWITA